MCANQGKEMQNRHKDNFNSCQVRVRKLISWEETDFPIPLKMQITDT